LVAGSLGIQESDRLEVTTRFAPVATMVVEGHDGALYFLRHGVGDAAASVVERLDPVSLDPLFQSRELAGGPVWPAGLGVHPNGSIYVVFGNHAHCLDEELRVKASKRLPRERPYNSFVLLADGHMVTKDFGGSRPGVEVPPERREPCELVVLDPDLEVVDRLEMGEPSIARLSALDDDVYVVGDPHLRRAHWNGSRLELDDSFAARYRTLDGQTYGWDCVIAAGAAWFLDDGDGSERFDGTLKGKGLSTAPLHLVRVDLESAEVTLTEVCGLPGGLVANPPVVDEVRRVVVGYDSGNGVVVGFHLETLEPLWRRRQDHASHFLLYGDSGELVTGDHADVVVLEVSTGAELARADTGSAMQSVLFPAPGPGRSFFICSLATVSRVEVV
jgi:hypothetical protein